MFDVDESTHKGLGRLVYLCYFEDVYLEEKINLLLSNIIELKKDWILDQIQKINWIIFKHQKVQCLFSLKTVC